MNPDITYKVLVAGDFGVGKTIFGLGLSRHLGEKTMVSFDWENGQAFYIAKSPEFVRLDGLSYYVRRIERPTIYEVRFLVEKIKDPRRPASQIQIDRKPVILEALSEPVKTLATDITKGTVVVGAINFDTITRLGDLTVQRIFGQYTEDKAEKMSQIIWGKVKDDLSEIFYSIIDANVHLVVTAWAKARYDTEARRSTNELIADVLKNVNAFVDLSLLLKPNPKSTPQHVMPPMAQVLKSRIERLPTGLLLAKATWETIFQATPNDHVVEETIEIPDLARI